VDSGLVENIPVVHVYPTLLCDDTPQLSVSCQLHGIQPVRVCVCLCVCVSLCVCVCVSLCVCP